MKSKLVSLLAVLASTSAFADCYNVDSLRSVRGGRGYSAILSGVDKPVLVDSRAGAGKSGVSTLVELAFSTGKRICGELVPLESDSGNDRFEFKSVNLKN